MISTLFGKKKIAEDKAANVFVNAILRLSEEGFPLVVEELRESPEFLAPPVFGPGDDELFAQLILAGNLLELPNHVDAGHDRRIATLAIAKAAEVFNVPAPEFEQDVRDLMSFMGRINQPSKNTVLAMSKAVFHKYDLFRHQDAYFRDVKAPNPIVLKRLKELMGWMIWDWREYQEHFRIVA
jgi:hypothetical protein